MTDTELQAGYSRTLREVYVLQGAQIDFYWPQIVELFETVPGWWEYQTPAATYVQVKKGHYQVWALADSAIRAIVLTQILEFPRRRVFEIMAIGGIGTLEFFNETADVFERFARQNRCEEISAYCRPGLAHLLSRRFGAETRMVVLRKQLPPLDVEQ